MQTGTICDPFAEAKSSGIKTSFFNTATVKAERKDSGTVKAEQNAHEMAAAHQNCVRSVHRKFLLQNIQVITYVLKIVCVQSQHMALAGGKQQGRIPVIHAMAFKIGVRDIYDHPLINTSASEFRAMDAATADEHSVTWFQEIASTLNNVGASAG